MNKEEYMKKRHDERYAQWKKDSIAGVGDAYWRISFSDEGIALCMSYEQKLAQESKNEILQLSKLENISEEDRKTLIDGKWIFLLPGEQYLSLLQILAAHYDEQVSNYYKGKLVSFTVKLEKQKQEKKRDDRRILAQKMIRNVSSGQNSSKKIKILLRMLLAGSFCEVEILKVIYKVTSEIALENFGDKWKNQAILLMCLDITPDELLDQSYYRHGNGGYIKNMEKVAVLLIANARGEFSNELRGGELHNLIEQKTLAELIEFFELL